LFDGEHDWYVFIFTAENFSGKLIDSSEGNLEWIPNNNVTSLNLWDGDKIFLEWLYQKKFFSAKFNYENRVMKDYTVNFY
jgi:8-oxo-dGTP diphosphatase